MPLSLPCPFEKLRVVKTAAAAFTTGRWGISFRNGTRIWCLQRTVRSDLLFHRCCSKFSDFIIHSSTSAIHYQTHTLILWRHFSIHKLSLRRIIAATPLTRRHRGFRVDFPVIVYNRRLSISTFVFTCSRRVSVSMNISVVTCGFRICCPEGTWNHGLRISSWLTTLSRGSWPGTAAPGTRQRSWSTAQYRDLGRFVSSPSTSISCRRWTYAPQRIPSRSAAAGRGELGGVVTPGGTFIWLVFVRNMKNWPVGFCDVLIERSAL